jgi:hypothetical protein
VFQQCDWRTWRLGWVAKIHGSRLGLALLVPCAAAACRQWHDAISSAAAAVRECPSYTVCTDECDDECVRMASVSVQATTLLQSGSLDCVSSWHAGGQPVDVAPLVTNKKTLLHGWRLPQAAQLLVMMIIELLVRRRSNMGLPSCDYHAALAVCACTACAHGVHGAALPPRERLSFAPVGRGADGMLWLEWVCKVEGTGSF